MQNVPLETLYPNIYSQLNLADKLGQIMSIELWEGSETGVYRKKYICIIPSTEDNRLYPSELQPPRSLLKFSAWAVRVKNRWPDATPRAGRRTAAGSRTESKTKSKLKAEPTTTRTSSYIIRKLNKPVSNRCNRFPTGADLHAVRLISHWSHSSWSSKFYIKTYLTVSAVTLSPMMRPIFELCYQSLQSI